MKLQLYNKLLIMIVILNYYSYCQSQDLLDEFKISEIDNKVKLDWVISSGKTCNGTKIYKSLDSINFELISSIEGVCGSEYFRQPFTFVDEVPSKNKKSFYQLEFGGYGKSKILSIEIIDTYGIEYLLYPNPLLEPARILIDNNSNRKLNLKVFDIQGLEWIDLFTTDEYFTIDTDKLLSGNYYFVVFNNKKEIKAKGKFQVLK